MQFNTKGQTNRIMIICGARLGLIFHFAVLATVVLLLSATAPAQQPAQNGAHLVAKASSGEDSTTSVSKDWRGVSRKEINTTELATALGTTADDKTIRPFRVNIPEEQLVDLRRRIAATKWPERELVSDATQGVQLATMKKLADYWVNHNWRKTEAKLNSYPQFITNIDGLDIHFIHVRSKNPNALPVIITHGWPGSVIEQLKIIGPLTDPVKYGGKAEDSFDVVIPSLPGYGFSGKPTATGWDPQRVARAWAVLMDRLGYKRYVAQGGDWGNAVTEQMALQQPAGLIGIHTNMPATIPDDIAKALASGGPAPSGLSDEEKYAYDQVAFFYKHGLGCANEMANRPQTLYGIADSPIGLAAWIIDHDS
ncbi:MAG TPA: epoxide hydrolase [Pyrinomonadaceae bacterium]|nr:epoxide hydrolase [Pyrinomonadaceae bacterium]